MGAFRSMTQQGIGGAVKYASAAGFSIPPGLITELFSSHPYIKKYRFLKELLTSPEMAETLGATGALGAKYLTEAAGKALFPPTFLQRHSGKILGGAAGLGTLGLAYGMAVRPDEYDPR